MKKKFHCVYDLHYHLVVVTKYRRRCITGPMLERIRGILEARCADWEGDLIEFNGEKDHVHALVSMPPSVDLSRFINNFKTTSSRLVRRDFPQHVRKFYRDAVFWSRSYCIVSCGGAPLEIIKKYLDNQKTPE